MPIDPRPLPKPDLIRSDLDNTREDERYGESHPASPEKGSERFPEVAPDGRHSARGGYDRYGQPDPTKEDSSDGFLLQQDAQAEREEQDGQHAIKADGGTIPSPAQPARQSEALEHQIAEESSINRHADWEHQVRQDKENPTRKK